MDDDEIDIEGDDDMGIGNDRSSIPHHHVHTPSDSFLSELPETSSWILDSFGDWSVDDDQKSKEFHNMLQEEEHLDAPSSGRHHLSPAKHAHSHHTLAHSPTTDGTLDKSENPKKRGRVLFQSHSEDEGSEDSGKKGDGSKKARTIWSADEQRLFREAISKFGKDYRKVQIHIGTRTLNQVRSYAQKHFSKQRTPKLPSQSTPAITSSTGTKHSPVVATSPDDVEANTPARSGSESDSPVPSGENSMNSSTAKSSSRGASTGNGKHLPSHNTPWTTEEQKAFTEGLGMYGKGNWKVISNHIGSRTPLQVKYLARDKRLTIIRNHARQYFKKMAKMGVTIDVEVKPKLLVEKEKKRKVEVDKPMQALLEVVRPQIIRKEYHPEEEDEEIDILGEEGNESPVEVAENEMKLKAEERQSIPALIITPTAPSISQMKATTNKTITKESDIRDSPPPTTIKHSSDEHEVVNQITIEPPTNETFNDSYTMLHQPHQCTKCNHICNNCSNSNTINHNNNNSNNNNSSTENNDYVDECDDEGGFESHIDCPTPTEEKVFDVGNVSPEETTGNNEFFCGNSAKTPERYLKIRNTIVDQWLKHKPKYLSKTSVRTSLKDCGDVNAIGRVHEFLELTGAINFGADRPPRHRHPPATHPPRPSAPHQSLSPSQQPQSSHSQPSTCNHTCIHHSSSATEAQEEVTGPRKRRVRSRTGEWNYEDDQPTTFEHKLSSTEDGQEYEQRFAALNAKYFVEEDDAKRRLPRNKRTKYTNPDSAEDVAPYDPFRLIPCSRTLPPIASTATSTTSSSNHSTSFTLSVQSTALALYQRVCTSPFVGIIVSPYDPRHPSDVSLFNYVVVGDEWSVNHEYQVPYEVPRTIVSDLPTPALFKEIAEIITNRVDMNKMFRRGERLTCLEKMLRSISGHYFVSKGVSGDEQALLVSKIRSLFQKIEKAEKSAKHERLEKLDNIQGKSGADRLEKVDATQYEKSEKMEGTELSKSTGKRKKDLMQLHQQQQQQRLQQQTQQHAQQSYQQALQQTLQHIVPEIPQPLPVHSHTPAQAHPHAQQLQPQPPSPLQQQMDQAQLHQDQKHSPSHVPIKIQQKQQRHQQTVPITPTTQPATKVIIPLSSPLTITQQINQPINQPFNQSPDQLVYQQPTPSDPPMQPPLQPIHQTIS